MPFATGTALVPTLMPGEPAEIVVTLDRPMQPPQCDVSLLPNAALLEAHAEVKVVSYTEDTVTLSIVVEKGLAGAGAVFVVCMPQTGPPAESPPHPTPPKG